MKRILILGGDGYLGWATAMYFSARGHDVHTVDNYLRRRAHDEAGTNSLTPIGDNLPARAETWRQVTGEPHGLLATLTTLLAPDRKPTGR